MAQVINTNSLSLLTQNNLNKSQSALGNAIERLSSGLRINSAKDDAAGQAIANRFTANIKGLSQAARNANDGISIAQTTEGALNEINTNLQRIRELTVQAQNGSNSESDISSINDEVTQRFDEIDRISKQTQFNGVNVLSKDSELTIQVGANDNETITINLKQIDKGTLGLDKFNVNSLVGVHVGVEVKEIPKGDGSPDKTPVKPVTDLDSVKDPKVVKSIDKDGKEIEGEYVITGKDKETGEDVYYKATIDNEGNVKVGVKTNLIDKNAKPLGDLDNALSQVDKLRSSLGAIQNRFESTVNNLNNTVNNLSAARSRIQDADYATEVSNMSRGQILQQAGTAVLVQANQVPQTVLSLLR
ncbi:flagellin [Photorhabdus temperata]|uniref:Flagellin n=1 Tax=Photorhabdus khanii NC19 TaxID=1004151 RepID=W3V316_9GAMM|nr:flagellin FliC [Photorhabdus khanii]ETS30198.1 flagellin/flagellar hook associated protein [Photorhabdus khanii NC19]OHV51573.1 flagellin [Photorhabdus temperata]